MTDDAGVLGDWRVVLAGALAVLTASSVTLISRTSDPAGADTYVLAATNAAVQLADGRLLPAEIGARVPEGAVVRTGDCVGHPCGAATLRTADRDLYLGASSTMLVLDGVHGRLDKGLAMVDSRRGTGLDLATPAGTVTIGSGGLVRVELNNLYMRLCSFEGQSHIISLGRQNSLEVPELYQAQVPYVGVPRGISALRLTEGDVWERSLAAELVGANRDLQSLAVGLDGTEGATVLAAVPAALRAFTDAGGMTTIGERALAAAVAGASGRSEQAPDRLQTVEDLRRGGGSWGVVAALVSARVSAVSALLDTWVVALRGPVLAGGPLPVGPIAGGPVFPIDPSPSTRPSAPRPTPSSTRSPSTSSPSPGPSASPDTAQEVMDIVNRLVSPSPTRSPGAGALGPIGNLVGAPR